MQLQSEIASRGNFNSSRLLQLDTRGEVPKSTDTTFDEKMDQPIEPGSIVLDINAKRIFSFVKNNDPKGLLHHLKQLEHPLDLMVMKDSLNFSLLSFCAFKDDPNSFKVIFEYAWGQSITEENITYKQI